MAAQNDPNTPANSSSLHSPSQSEHLSSKFLGESKLLMKSNVDVESSDSCGTTSTNDLLLNPELSSVPLPLAHQQSPSEMTALVAGSDIKPLAQPPGVVLHTTEKILCAEKGLQKSKQPVSSTPLSPVNRPPTPPLMEIIPPPLSHQIHPMTPLESIASSDNNVTSTPELQPLTEIQHTPLTESQIDDAKNLVLDLLGWGVDPEYLVTTGVHPELIRQIFNDLNLRLPTNLVFHDG